MFGEEEDLDHGPQGGLRLMEGESVWRVLEQTPGVRVRSDKGRKRVFVVCSE